MASPFDDVLDAVRAALEARRATLVERVSRLEAALKSYEQAVLQEIAEHFVAEHALKRLPKRPSGRDAARALAELVASLPELAEASSPRSAPDVAEPEPERVHAPPAARAPSPAKIVIIGGLSGREKSSALSPELEANAEWIDTERDGAHAIGNLPQRIRQGRVHGVVILDRVVQHKHTEPVVAAARDARVPVAFAGQGGKASLARAFAQIEEMRRERSGQGRKR